jgi:hypothetical protein
VGTRGEAGADGAADGALQSQRKNGGEVAGGAETAVDMADFGLGFSLLGDEFGLASDLASVLGDGFALPALGGASPTATVPASRSGSSGSSSRATPSEGPTPRGSSPPPSQAATGAGPVLTTAGAAASHTVSLTGLERPAQVAGSAIRPSMSVPSLGGLGGLGGLGSLGGLALSSHLGGTLHSGLLMPMDMLAATLPHQRRVAPAAIGGELGLFLAETSSLQRVPSISTPSHFASPRLRPSIPGLPGTPFSTSAPTPPTYAAAMAALQASAAGMRPIHFRQWVCKATERTTAGGDEADGARGKGRRARTKKQHACPHDGCTKTYSRKSHLVTHVHHHTGEKPYPCSVKGCTWRFRRRDELSRHLRTHSGSKPFECTLCNKRFPRRDHLRKHAKRHEEAAAPQPRKGLRSRSAASAQTQPQPLLPM